MFDRLHLRWQVVLCVGALQLAALGLAAAVMLSNARQAVELEMRSAASGARAQVIAAIGIAMRDHALGEVLPVLSDQLVQPRHVRLALFDAASGGALPVRTAAAEAAPEPAPGWFRRLVTPPLRETRLPVLDNGVERGFVSIVTAPEDEIAEVWQDVAAVFWALAAGFAGTVLVLMLVIRRALRPLATLSAGLRGLQEGRLDTRISDVRGPDFGPIVAGFNALSAGLERSEAERSALARKIVELGDAERRAIAMELHDEFGPCLFGLQVKAGAIRRSAAKSGDARLVGEAETVASIVEHMQTANTRLLTTLRPLTISELPLVEALEDLLDGFRSTHPGLRWSVSLPETLPAAAEIVELTVYRLLQEGVTNALRHGRPSHVGVSVRAAAGAGGQPMLELAVEDDGAGLDRDFAEGRGLRAMRDRVQAVGGRFALSARPGGGTRLAAVLPLVSAASAAPAVAAAP